MALLLTTDDQPVHYLGEVMSYTPNFADPRVLKRATSAYGFALACLNPRTSWGWSKSMLDKHFGQQNAPLSRWLRAHLLICTNNYYSMDDGEVKQYRLNTTGAAIVKHCIQQAAKVENIPALQTASKKSVVEVQPGSEVHLPAIDLFDREVTVAWVKREFGDDLKTGKFNYTDKSNRLWHNLQNVKSDIRTEVLRDNGFLWHYDIECCAPTLIHQWANMQPDATGEVRFALEHYLKNRHEVREAVSLALNITVKQAKTLLNALFCGARLGANRDYALFWVLDGDYDKVRAAQKNEYLTALRADIKACWDEIEPSLPKRTKTKNGKTRKLPLNSKAKWSCYFDLERRVMREVRAYLKQHDGKHFLIHDGFATSFELNTSDLEQHILNQTNFVVRLEAKKVE